MSPETAFFLTILTAISRNDIEVTRALTNNSQSCKLVRIIASCELLLLRVFGNLLNRCPGKG